MSVTTQTDSYHILLYIVHPSTTCINHPFVLLHAQKTYFKRTVKGSRMGHSVKVSLWCITLLINTTFCFFILE